jgi:DNA-3-methyladenine glycosylase I
MGPPPKIDPQSLNDYLEIMTKSVFQSGMSWQVINAKWPGIKEAFENFDIQKIANYKENKIEALMEDTRVIRNYRKLMAIVSNAKKMIELDTQHGSFKNYLRSQDNFDATIKQIKKDFKFMGPMGIYVFLYVVGEDVIAHEEFQKQYKKSK